MTPLEMLILVLVGLNVIAFIWLNEKIENLNQGHEDRIVHEEADMLRVKRQIDSLWTNINAEGLSDHLDATVVCVAIQEEVHCEDC